jgi:hypothetical protein
MILDGHNAAFRLRLGGLGESGRRQALLDYFSRKRPQGDATLWIVFDSRHNEDAHGYWLDRETYSVRVVYAAGSFDDWVVAQSNSGELEEDTVVVTDDRDLRFSLSGRVICRSLDEFFNPRRR